jgi:hypothetical protein
VVLADEDRRDPGTRPPGASRYCLRSQSYSKMTKSKKVMTLQASTVTPDGAVGTDGRAWAVHSSRPSWSPTVLRLDRDERIAHFGHPIR